MQRFHTLRIAIVISSLCFAGACGDDDDDDTTTTDGGGAGSASTTDAGGDTTADAGKTPDAASPDSDGGADGEAIELVGSWKGEFSDEVIDETTWNGAKLIEFDNDDNIAITQYPKDDMYNPSKFAKQVWTEPTADGFYYCTVEFSLDTLAAAQASTATADDSDPATKGCGAMDFPWTKLEAK